jgi:hypothetical protein
MSSDKNLLKFESFKEFRVEEDNKGTEAHLQELYITTMAFQAKQVTDHDVWKCYRTDLLANHRDENGN